MYRPPAFVEDDAETLVALARTAGFGHLVVSGPNGIESTPLPFVIDDRATVVRAHLARPNPIWRSAPCAALLVVPVSDTYVSPGWYPSKAEHGKVVPTWNYEVVHIHGELIVRDDPEWVAQQIRDLTDINESGLPTPWSVDDPPEGYVAKTAKGIIGLELVVARIEGKRKLSQNRPEADQHGVVTGLEATRRRGADQVRQAMTGR
jgi:transcriptional regulator